MQTHVFKTVLALTVLAATFAPHAAAATTPEGEARFITAARKAFDTRQASDLSQLTCWDRVPEKLKKAAKDGYAAMVAEKDVSFDVKLIDPDLKFVAKDRNEEGVVYRPNLLVVKQLNVKVLDKDRKTLMMVCFPVGEKESRLLVAGFASAK